MPPLEAYDGQQLQENGLGQVRGFLDEWEGVKEEIVNSQLPIVNCQLTLVTGTLFAPVLAEKAAEFSKMTGVNLNILPVVNQRLGETITVAGLLMGLDVLEALQTAVSTTDLFILPRVMFDHPDTITLDDISPQDIANRLQTPHRPGRHLGRRVGRPHRRITGNVHARNGLRKATIHPPAHPQR